MSKIIRAINTIISHPEKISNVIEGNEESDIFFLFDGRYKWSIDYNGKTDDYLLYFYPGNDTIETLAGVDDWDDYNVMRYSSKELKSAEARQSFKELYDLVREKVFGIDKVLEDIIQLDAENN